MKKFFKDYGELCKSTGRFYKNHWFGTIIMNIVVTFICILLFWPKELKEYMFDNVKEKFSKKEKEEEA